MRLRSKLYVIVLPPVALLYALSAFHSFQQSTLAVNRLANRHMSFKAEQLRDYANSEWEVLSKLGLGGKPEYRAAMEESFRSYAASLLRGESESVAVFDSGGAPLMAIGRMAAPGGVGESLAKPLPEGWFSRRLFGERRVGVAFAFPALGWTVAVSDLEASYFSEPSALFISGAGFSAAAVGILVALLAFYLKRLLKPLERLSLSMRRLGSSEDLSLRARVESSDEIGLLASEFNAMVSKLEENYRSLGISIEAEREAQRKAEERETETVRILGRVSDFRDEDTGGHLKRIGELSALFFRLLGQDEETQEIMRNAAPLHDIGKIGIPDSILLKPGPLNDEEREVMKRHAALGYELLKGAQGIYLAVGAIIASSHHERWDGTGYPRGLKGNETPLTGRVVGLLDVFDALISKRCYKDAWPMEQARDFIAAQRGRHFDPELADLFVQRFPEFRERAEGIQAEDFGAEEADGLPS